MCRCSWFRNAFCVIPLVSPLGTLTELYKPRDYKQQFAVTSPPRILAPLFISPSKNSYKVV